jgi:septal ring factor EnvC (AmiA/AmiB activator)
VEENSNFAGQLAEVADVKNHLDQLKQTLSQTENELTTCQTQLQCTREESQQMADESRKMMEQLDRSSDRIYQLEQLNNESEFKARETEGREGSRTWWMNIPVL